MDATLVVMLEATLMNKNAQKRGELEPVIRHATNLSIKEPQAVKTIFIADELDDNVLNIFRAASFIDLQGTNIDGIAEGVNIFALTINELKLMLENQIDTNHLFSVIDNNQLREPTIVKSGWREPIIKQVFDEVK